MNAPMLALTALTLSLPCAADDPFATTTPGKAGTDGVVPSLVGKGLGSVGSFVDLLAIGDAASSSTAQLVVGSAELAAPFLGGVLGPSPDTIVFGLPVARSGELTIPFRVPPGFPAGTQVWLQAWVDDPGARGGLSATNTLRFEVQPPPSGPLFPNAQYAAGDFPRSIATGDLDGDGHDDIVTLSGGSSAPSVVVLIGRGDGAFEPGVTYAEDTQPEWVSLGDLDGDGALDIVFSDDALDVVHTLHNVGDGTFDSLQTHALAGEARVTAVDDLDGDGFADVVAAIPETNEVSVLLGVGDGSLATPVSYPAGTNPARVVIGHVDRDGIPDLVVSSDDVLVWRGVGDGTFTPIGVVPIDSAIVRLADMDGDDVSDLVVSSEDDTVSVVPGHGDGTFGAAVTVVPLDDPFDLVTTDVDLDGQLDVVVTRLSPPDALYVLFGGGDGTLRRGPDLPVGDEPREIAAADFDGDGVPDLAAVNTVGDDVTVLLGAREDFAVREQYDVGREPNGVDVGDLDGDGRPDVAVTVDGSFLDDGVWLLFGAGEGRLRQAVQISLQGPAGVVVEHIDTDGVLDLAVLTGAGAVRVLLGTGDGNFVEASGLAANGSRAVALGDLDADGIADVVTANTGADGVTVALGVGDGSFLPVQSYAVGNGPTDVALADFDGDGVLDIAVGLGLAPGGMAVLLGVGDGTFGPATLDPLGGTQADALAVGDVDGDGVIDLVAVDDFDELLLPLIGQGDGTFVLGSPRDLGALSDPFALELGDVDGDGVLDAAVTSETVIHDAAVLRGNGDGTFGELEVFGVGEFPSDLALADLDGDGLLDLVVTNFGSDDVTVLLNQLAR